MSGIYISGMELPKGGFITVEIGYDADGEPMALVYENDTEEPQTGICDVIPVTDHGRLIDASSFEERMEGLQKQAMADGFDSGAFWYAAFVQHIKLSPTVIPAEEDGK